MHRILALLFLLSPFCFAAGSQQDGAVIAVVQRLFDAMASRDVESARGLLLPGGSYAVVRDGGAVTQTSHAEFLARLAKGKEKLLERMWNPKVLLHGGIAVLWTEYDFHRDGRFSHCGVDTFNLVRTGEGWKIASFSYTVETSGCGARGSAAQK